MPLDCSSDAAEISPIRLVTRCTESSISRMVAPARSTGRAHADLLRGVLDQLLDLLGRCGAGPACAPRSRPRRSPCPARRARASTAAFSARILVWKAMPSITPTISAMRAELPEMARMVSTTPATASPPRRATLPIRPPCGWPRARCPRSASRWKPVPPCWPRSAPATRPAVRCGWKDRHCPRRFRARPHGSHPRRDAPRTPCGPSRPACS